MRPARSFGISLLAAACLLPLEWLNAATPVMVKRLPGGGIKPSVAIDSAGALRVVYFTGKPEGGNAWYTTSSDGGATFAPPIQVNSQSGSVIGVSSIRGPQLALGKAKAVHILWNGASGAKPAAPLNPAMPADSKFNGIPLLYSRLDETGKRFEPQRNLMTKTCALDGGSAIVADDADNVFAVWHALEPGGKGEEARSVWMALSKDGGRTFAPENSILNGADGVCGCCSLSAHIGVNGSLAILFRSATEGGSERPMNLLLSRDRGASFSRQTLDAWPMKTCPMSAETIAPVGRRFAFAWEGKDGIQLSWANLDAPAASNPASPSSITEKNSAGTNKLPSIAINKSGEILLAWTEGMGWNKRGALVWELFDAEGKQSVAKGRQDGVPANGTVAAAALPDGHFVILY